MNLTFIIIQHIRILSPEAARAGTDGYTDRQTHRTTTVTLAHARRGLTRGVEGAEQTGSWCSYQ